MEKIIGTLLMLIGTSYLIYALIFVIKGRYDIEKDFMSYWELSVKSSTIEEKVKQIDEFVNYLDNSNLKGKYNAMIFKTPNNSFDNNLVALKSLQQRLHQIKDMDISSFEYQTAIQQITEQEQGEANDMLRVFKGIWWKENHILLWRWVYFLCFIFSIIFFMIGAAMV